LEEVLKELIIFDLDGTLIDSAPDLAQSINHMLSKLGKEGFAEDVIREWIGNGAQVLVKRALCGSKEYEDHPYFEKGLEIFLNHYEKNLVVKTRLYPEVEETLHRIKEDSKIAIATNKPHPFVKPILESFGLDIFDMVVGASDRVRKKPYGDMLLHICETLGIEPENTLMVGDSKNDILAAKEAGIPSCLATYGYFDDEVFKLYPDYVIKSFDEVLKIAHV